MRADRVLRTSNVVFRLRQAKNDDLADSVKATADGCTCNRHGRVDDPVVGQLPDGQLLFSCPLCCEDAVREAYDAEPRLDQWFTVEGQVR